MLLLRESSLPARLLRRVDFVYYCLLGALEATGPLELFLAGVFVEEYWSLGTASARDDFRGPFR